MQSLLLFLLCIIDLFLVWKWLVVSRQSAQCNLDLIASRNREADQQRQIRELQFRCDCQSSLLKGDSVLHAASRWLGGPAEHVEPRNELGLQIALGQKAAVLIDYSGLTADQASLVRINGPVLASWEHEMLSGADLRAGEPVRIPKTWPAGTKGLNLIPYQEYNGNALVLLLSNLPQITGDSQRDRQLFLEMISQRSRATAVPTEPSMDEEVRLVKEMLELRTLTDIDFQSPLEMLSEFLSKLCQFCNYSRGALYLNRTEQMHLKSELTAQGGTGIERGLFQNWLAAEQQHVQAHLLRRDVVFLGPETTHGTSQPPFQSGLLLPLIHRTELLGQLVLTGQQINMPTEADLQLAKWGADYLINTMIKTANRAKTEDQARRDPLTQLANRQAFDEVLRRSIKHALGDDAEPCALILLDLDHFKSVNDTYGHPAGDAVLKHAAQIVQSVSHSRVTDQPLVARYGGEELAVILPGVGEAGASRIAEAIRDALQSSPAIHAGQEIRISTSGGVAICPLHASSVDGLIAAADTALYRAKRLGRNRVEIAMASTILDAGH